MYFSLCSILGPSNAIQLLSDKSGSTENTFPGPRNKSGITEKIFPGPKNVLSSSDNVFMHWEVEVQKHPLPQHL